ncbi:hypothetical protein ABIC55_001344 [Sporosarcina psychrophila]|uniref:Uncharacterized protein n=1 Tax=Sporosarcina psychrophila TaxID=1476 RepID=A0ABV2K6M8_SPOPS
MLFAMHRIDKKMEWINRLLAQHSSEISNPIHSIHSPIISPINERHAMINTMSLFENSPKFPSIKIIYLFSVSNKISKTTP